MGFLSSKNKGPYCKGSFTVSANKTHPPAIEINMTQPPAATSHKIAQTTTWVYLGRRAAKAGEPWLPYESVV